MKKQLLFSIALGTCIGVSAQNGRTASGKVIPKINPALANIAVPYNPAGTSEQSSQSSISAANSSKPATGNNQNRAMSTATIGTTIYDLQTNRAIGQTAVLNPDGTISTVWNLSHASVGTSTPDRGTGYNYFNGTSWGTQPTARLENVRCGWPSIGVTSTGKEIIVSHLADGTSHNLVMMSRPAKGTGAWTQTSLGIPDTWARMVVGGANGQTIHMFAQTQGAAPANPPYQNQTAAISYSRSQDGGLTWDLERTVIPQIDYTQYFHFGGDDYDVDVQGDNLAVVIGGLDVDVILLKSSDNGTTWTKTIVNPFPIPLFDPASMSSDIDNDGNADTLDTNDGSVQVLLDNSGKAHVWFGHMRMIGDGAAVSYFPGTDGLMYWNENMGANAPVMIAAAEDLTGSGTTGTLDVSEWGSYGVSLTSMPSASIDASGTIYLSYSSIYEGLAAGGDVAVGKSYRHIYLMKSVDNGNSWCAPADIAVPAADDYTEFVFGSLTRKTDGDLHMIYQRDSDPGNALALDNSGAQADVQNGPSDYVYVKMPVSDLPTCAPLGITENNVNSLALSLSPNPAEASTSLAFRLATKGNVTINVYNVTGQVVSSVTNQDYAAGSYNINLNTEKYDSGIYFVNMITADGTVSKKLIIK